MLRDFKSNITCKTVDGSIKVWLDEQDFNDLVEYLEVMDDLLARIKLTIYAEQNALIHFNYAEMDRPTLENFGILLKNGKMEQKMWFKYKDVIFKENKKKEEWK